MGNAERFVAVNLPGFIWHVTEKQYICSIQREGVLPKFITGENTEPRVYVCLDLFSARRLIEERQKVTDKDYVTLKIDTSKLDHKFFKDFATHPDVAGAWTLKTIPSQALVSCIERGKKVL